MCEYDFCCRLWADNVQFQCELDFKLSVNYSKALLMHSCLSNSSIYCAAVTIPWCQCRWTPCIECPLNPYWCISQLMPNLFPFHTSNFTNHDVKHLARVQKCSIMKCKASFLQDTCSMCSHCTHQCMHHHDHGRAHYRNQYTVSLMSHALWFILMPNTKVIQRYSLGAYHHHRSIPSFRERHCHAGACITARAGYHAWKQGTFVVPTLVLL